MFTGIVETVGTVRAIRDLETTRRFGVQAGEITSGLASGDSISVDGACLTVVEIGGDGFQFDVIGTTLERTIAGTYVEGSEVNLERALRADGRLDGHFVQGHVDGVGAFMQSTKSGEFWVLDFELPADVAAQTVERGSIAINGVSLTVAEMPGERVCRVGLIPFTHGHTNLGRLQPRAPVNVEGDVIGKYVGRMLASRAP